MTHHLTLLAMDEKRGCLVQVKQRTGHLAAIEISQADVKALEGSAIGTGANGVPITSGALAGYTYVKPSQNESFSLFKGNFASAIANKDDVEINRKAVLDWEIFRFVTPETADAGLRVLRENAVGARVQELTQQKKPVLLHVGCGNRRLNGFLNIDKSVRFGGHLTDYYRFPYADKAWPMPDESVDYIYSEDFIEHIPQRNQVAFLAEAYRVLKPGCYHRVNTPCLVDSMRVHSDFKKGFDGVYFGEFDKWDHISVFTRGMMTDIAGVIGYRQVYFTAKSCGSSPFAVPDIRPVSDRDDVTGNIFADLLK
jgi:predicted SAM-dependent methyltransferase